jgi:hypothetical protein
MNRTTAPNNCRRTGSGVLVGARPQIPTDYIAGIQEMLLTPESPDAVVH